MFTLCRRDSYDIMAYLNPMKDGFFGNLLSAVGSSSGIDQENRSNSGVNKDQSGVNFQR